MSRVLFQEGAHVVDHRWPSVVGVVLTVDPRLGVHVQFENGRYLEYTHERAPIMLSHKVY